MLTSAKLITNYSRYRDAELEQKAQAVLDALSNNPRFPEPLPGFDQLPETLERYERAVAAAQINEGKLEVMRKNEARRQLMGVLQTLAVNIMARGPQDLETLLSTGFDLAKSPTPVGVLAKPTNFRLKPGLQPGSVALDLDPVRGARAYLFQYTTAPVTAGSTWTSEVAPRSNTTIGGLASGQQYAFRVAGIGTNETRIFSDVLTTFVL